MNFSCYSQSLFHSSPSWTPSVGASHLLAHLWCKLLLGNPFCAAVTTGCLQLQPVSPFQPWLSLDVTWYTCVCSLEIVKVSTLHETELQKGTGVYGTVLPFFFPQSENPSVSSTQLLRGSSPETWWVTWPLSLPPPLPSTLFRWVHATK